MKKEQSWVGIAEMKRLEREKEGRIKSRRKVRKKDEK